MDQNERLFGVKFNWILMEQFSILIVFYSLIARHLLSMVIKYLRFTSQSLQTLIILFGVIIIYSLNYMLLYMTAPFNISGKWNQAYMNEK